MDLLLNDYLPIAVFIGVALFIGGAALAGPFFGVYLHPHCEKGSPAACGFNAFDDARMKFDIRFYLTAILFIIFDIEAAFMFPWAVSFTSAGEAGFWAMMVFIAELLLGYIYVWRRGALEWD